MKTLLILTLMAALGGCTTLTPKSTPDFSIESCKAKDY